MRVAVIGGGPSGLTQLKYLLEARSRFDAKLDVRLFEGHDSIGGIFFHHSYEEGELVSSKYLTSFSDFRPRKDDADFLSSDRYLEYLNDYASHFGLWPHINLNTWVKSVRRGTTSQHVVTYQAKGQDVEEWECDAIAVCAGVHSIPSIPNIPGLEHVPVVMHSEEFKGRHQFGSNKTVMVVGSGETGCDVAYLAITGDTKRVLFCHRDGWLGAPKRIIGQRFLPWLFGSEEVDYPQCPNDVSQFTLFDTMYVHPRLRDSMAIWDFYHYGAFPMGCWLVSGSMTGIDTWVGEIRGERFHGSRLFFNKAWQRISNNVAFPYRPKQWSLATRIRKFFFNTEIPPPKRVIDVAPFPSHISADGVAHFPVNGRPEADKIQEEVVKPDVIILATGYLPSFPFLNTPDNDGNKPYPTAFDADVRNIWKADDPTIGFIGFVRPGFGAIPPLSELQSMMFTLRLLGKVPRTFDPDDEWHYRMIHAPDQRVTYGVEHDSYAYQLAKDMDIAPSFTEILMMALTTKNGYRIPWLWAAGACLNTKFRLRGPWKWEGARGVMTGELWETIQRREGLFGNIPLSFLPMCYLGTISFAYWAYSCFWGFLSALGLSKPLERRLEPKMLIEELAMKKKMDMKMGTNTKMNGKYLTNCEDSMSCR